MGKVEKFHNIWAGTEIAAVLRTEGQYLEP
jgi:hypothetical protein